MRTVLPCQGIAGRLLLGAMLFASATAAADPRSEVIDRIMATGPLPCIEAAHPFMAPVWRDFLADEMTDEIRLGWRLNDKWEAGNPDFNRARFMIKEGIARSERRLGPLLWPTSAAAGVRAGFQKLPLPLLRQFEAFLSTPNGKLYWANEIDLATCASLLRMDGGAAPTPGRALRKMIKSYRDRRGDNYKEAEASQRKDFLAWERKLDHTTFRSFAPAMTAEQMRTRRSAIFRRDIVELDRIVEPYRLPPKNPNDSD